MFATCIAHQPELVETEIMQSTLKEDVLCVFALLNIHAACKHHLFWMSFIVQSKNLQQDKREEKAQEQVQMLRPRAALTMSMVPWPYSYCWIHTGVTKRK